jgi:hypothetical protein
MKKYHKRQIILNSNLNRLAHQFNKIWWADLFFVDNYANQLDNYLTGLYNMTIRSSLHYVLNTNVDKIENKYVDVLGGMDSQFSSEVDTKIMDDFYGPLQQTLEGNYERYLQNRGMELEDIEARLRPGSDEEWK